MAVFNRTFHRDSKIKFENKITFISNLHALILRPIQCKTNILLNPKRLNILWLCASTLYNINKSVWVLGCEQILLLLFIDII